MFKPTLVTLWDIVLSHVLKYRHVYPVWCYCVVSLVFQLVPGAAASVAVPAHTGRAALPVQTLWQRWEHHWRRRPEITARAAALAEPEVHNHTQSTSQPIHAKWDFYVPLCVSLCSPGRSPSCYDNETVMMNHVYKERFPKVNETQTNTSD